MGIVRLIITILISIFLEFLLARFDIPFFIILGSLMLSFETINEALASVSVVSLLHELSKGKDAGTSLISFSIAALIATFLFRFVSATNEFVRLLHYVLNVGLGYFAFIISTNIQNSSSISIEGMRIENLVVTLIAAVGLYLVVYSTKGRTKPSYFKLSK